MNKKKIHIAQEIINTVNSEPTIRADWHTKLVLTSRYLSRDIIINNYIVEIVDFESYSFSQN